MKRIFLLSLIAIYFLASCDRSDTPMGPNINQVFGDFEIEEELSVNQDTVNFANGEIIQFSAKWTTLEEWNLTITGKKSKAVKIFSGYDAALDESNAKWKGETTELPIFRKEICYVELTFDGEAAVFYDTIYVEAPKENEGVLVTDFESGVNPLWPNFYQAGVNFFEATSRPAAEGKRFLDCSGTVPWDFLIGLIEFPADLTSGTETFDLTTNASNVFFNVMVFGDINKSNSFFIFRFYEDENGDGEWDPNSEDLWSTVDEYTLFTGWRLFSYNYGEDLVRAQSGDGSKGNGRPDSDKILSVEYLLLSDPAQGEARGDIDYLIFTEEKPLEP